jgi:hypothetical protein
LKVLHKVRAAALVNRLNRGLESLDRVFLAFFARRLERFPNVGPEAAWHSASWTVSMYLILPFSASMILLAATSSALTGSELTSQNKHYWLIVAAMVYVVVGMFLDRRFRSLVGPFTALKTANESENRQIRTRFRIMTIGCFVVACIVARLVYISGLG